MTDTPTIAPPPEPDAPASRADVAAALAALPESERQALLAQAALQEPEPDTTAGPSILADKQVGDDPLHFTSSTGKPAPVLRVDDQLYRCRRKPPGQVLVDALEARDSGDRTRMAIVMLDLLRACLVGEAAERYFGRFDGSDLRPRNPETGEVVEGAEELDPLGLDDVAVHGARLLEHYSGRPTVGRAPSGS